MNPQFSLYLELVRILATAMVFFAHSALLYSPLEDFNEGVKFGRDGVIVFFVLSGYVISWCAHTRDSSLGEFAINRASRIYSVAMPGLLLGFLASIVVALTEHQQIPFQFSKPWIYLPLYMTFTGNWWQLNELPPGNAPYWSLNYEVWYYVIFAAAFYVRNPWRWPLTFGLIAMVGPSLWQLFPIWLMGSALYWFCDRLTLKSLPARVTLITTLGLLILVKATAADTAVDEYNGVFWKACFGSNSAPKQLLGDYLLAVIVAANFIAAQHAGIVMSPSLAKHVRRIASYSFGFYLFHMPVFIMLNTIVPVENRSPLVYIIAIAAAVLLIIFLGRHTEHKKEVYRLFFRRLWFGLRAKLIADL